MTCDMLKTWLWEALTVFANGCLSGLGGGSLAGAGTGLIANSSVGEGQSGIHKTIAAASATALCAIGNGVKRVLVWHDSHPIPNPFESEAPVIHTSSGNFDKITP